MFGPLLDVQMPFRLAWPPCQKWAKRQGFVAFPKTMARVGHLKQRCIFRGRHSTKGMFIRDVRRSGRSFPERGCILEHQICRFAKMILRDRCGTLYDLASVLRGTRCTLDRWSGKNCKTQWYKAVSSALNLPFLKEVSQNCFVFDVANFKHWGSLVELLTFWHYQVQKLRTSRSVLYILTWKCASRHNGVHLFDSSTSKSAPNVRCS